MRFLNLILLLFFCSCAFGQNGLRLFYNTPTSILFNSNLSDQSAYSGSLNPSNMVYMDKFHLSAGLANAYFINSLNYSAIFGSYKIGLNQAIGCQIYYGGSDVFNDIILSPSYALKLEDGTSIGLTLHGMVTTSPENENLYSGTFTLGASTAISPQLSLGFLTFNAPGFFKKTASNDLTHHISMGLGYSPASYVKLFLSGILVDRHDLSVSGGVAYHIKNKFQLYLGMQTNPGRFGIGINVPFNNSFKAGLGVTNHLQLGTSPNLTLIYEK